MRARLAVSLFTIFHLVAVSVVAQPPDAGVEAELFADLHPEANGSSDPVSLLSQGDDLLVMTYTGEAGSELFRVTRDGVVERPYASEHLAGILGPAGSRAIFTTLGEDPIHGPTQVSALEPRSGTVEELAVVPRVIAYGTLGERLFFVTFRQISSSAIFIIDDLWRTEGTPETTVLLVSVGNGSYSAPTPHLQEWRGELFFAGFSDADGFELWRTDGTPEGTRLALDLEPGPESSSPLPLAASDERLYLLAQLGGQPTLVATDGTARGTRALPFHGAIRNPAVLGDRLLWVSPSPVPELWVSDGSPAGTGPLRAFEQIRHLTASGGRVFFAATTREHGSELWATDGTAGGTRLLVDLEPGPGSSDPGDLAGVAGVLLFSARTAAAGRELWVSNGTPEGTWLVADVAPGPAGSMPRHVTPFGDRIVFSAHRDDVGRELFALPRAALTSLCVADEGALCLNGDRFRVEVSWRDFAGRRGSGRVVPYRADDSGLFYFFVPDNWELLVKVLDGCGFNDRFWVFSAATTNVEYRLRITDTARGVSREYFNPLGTAAAAITDVEAFATCP